MKTKKKKKIVSRFLTLMLSLLMIVGALPATVSADGLGQVYVIVENTTYAVSDGAPWEGTLVEEWVDLESDSTMMSCIVDALEKNGYTQRGAENNYISQIEGLGEFDGGPMSGWMGTLNDWFTNQGFAAYTVAAGTLSDGDEIRVMYTCAYGEDIGGSWSNSDTTLKALSFSTGTLSPDFSGSIYEYELTISENVDSVVVTPTANNKNYQVRTTVNGTEYKRTAAVPIEEGTVITVTCGDPSWPGMNVSSGAHVYNVTVKYDVDTSPGGNDVGFEDIYKAVGDHLSSLDVQSVGSTGGEWCVIGLARSDRDVSEAYYDAVVAYVRANINENEQLDSNRSTENSRIILALTALGYDVTDVDGHNLLQGLTDMTYLQRQGINGPIWALIAFDSHDYEIPDAPDGAQQVTREGLIEYILDRQLDDGGWALTGSSADPDMTAMALQALAPYYSSNDDVKTAVDKALDRLSELQQDDGGFASWGSVNSESCAQVIVALTALGIDPATDSRFVKNDVSVLDALLSFATDDGGFEHVSGGGYDQMATEQGYYALVAYHRFINEQTSLYDMSDVTISGDQYVSEPEDSDITLYDVNGSDITVTGKESILSGLELEANLLTSGDLYDQAAEALKDGNFTLYALYLLRNNIEVQPDGTIAVSIPIPEGYDGAQCLVYLVGTDGSMTEIAAVLNDGKLVFETDYIGTFAVYQPVSVDSVTDGNGDDTTVSYSGEDGGDDTTVSYSGEDGGNVTAATSNTRVGNTAAPQTGDGGNMASWFIVSLFSLAVVIAIIQKRRNRTDKE